MLFGRKPRGERGVLLVPVLPGAVLRSAELAFEREPALEREPASQRVLPVAAGLSAGRWWLRRRGSLLEAIGVGVLVAVTVLVGGPMARTGAVVVSAAADLSAATDALGKGADRLNQL